MSNPRFSLVVPIYNAASFLEECLDSVCSQMPAECELILVDDGSTDESIDIVRKKFSRELENSRFRLLQIDNSGPGEARNTGVRAALGDYIGFLDSDDILLPGYFDAVFGAIRKDEPQIVQFHAVRFRTGAEAERDLIRCHNSANGSYRLDAVREDIFAVGKWFPVTRVFAKDLLMIHPFPSERVFYEDLTTLPFIFLENVQIVLLDMPLIAYRDNPGGTTRNHQPEHAATLVAFFKRLSGVPRCAATDILKVQVARTIVFFASELQLTNIPLADIFTQIRDIGGKFNLARHLRWVDRAFLWFPSGYAFAEKVRHGIRRAIG